MKKIILFSLIFLIAGLFVGPLFAQSDKSGEICGDGIDNDGDGFVDCYDRECDGTPACEDFFMGDDTSCEATPTEFPTFSMTKAWGSAKGTAATWSRATVGDVDGDGIPEVIVTNRPSKKIYVLNGSDGTIKQQINLNYEPEHGVALGKIDGVVWFFASGRGATSKKPEIEGYQFDMGTQKFTKKWEDNTGTLDRRPVVLGLADFKGTGNVQLYYKNEIRDAKTGTRLIAGAGNWEKNVNFAPVAVDILEDEECDHCTGLELVSGGVIYAVNLGNGTQDNGSLIKVKEISNYNVRADNNENWSGTSVADYNQDGFLDVIASGGDKNDNNRTTVFFWDVKNNTVKTFQPTNNWAKGTGRLNIADINGDGKLNVTFVSGNMIFALKEDFTIFWQQPIFEKTSGFTGTSVFDFNGDGAYEIVYRDEFNLYIIDGRNGEILNQEKCRSRTSSEYPIVVDVDGDGATEICVICNEDDNVDASGTSPHTEDGHVRVYKSNGENWVPSRKVWNQHTYFNVNVNDDLTIPRQQQKHHIEFHGGNCGTNGKNRPLNTFLNQSPYLDIHGCPTYGAPDFQVDESSLVIDTPVCPDQNFKISFKVLNKGDVGFSGTVPVAFYNGDPIDNVSNTTYLNTVFTEINDLKPGGEFEVKNLTVQGPGSLFTLYVAFNDSGSNVLPISFPSGSVLECDYDNVFSAAINPDPFDIVVEKQQDNISCGTSYNNGAAKASVAVGNNADYTFYWYKGSDVKATPDYEGAEITGLPEGTYTVQAEHNTAKCSSKTAEVEISKVSAIFDGGIEVVQDVTNCNASNGQLRAYLVDENGDEIDDSNYSFAWYYASGVYDDNYKVAIGNEASNLEPADYTVVITDGNSGCEITKNETIGNETKKPVVTIDHKDITTCDMSGGILEASVDGETTGYEFRWYDGENVDVEEDMPDHKGDKREDLPVGRYTVVAVNIATGCKSDPVDVTIKSNVAQPEITTTYVHPTTCSGTPNGSITLSISTPAPGSEPADGYDIAWYKVEGGSRVALSDLDDQTAASELGPDKYLILVTHPGTNCVSNEVHVELRDEKKQLSLNVTNVNDNAICDPTKAIAGDFDGAIEAAVKAGNTTITDFTGYTFTWVNVNTTETVTTTEPKLENLKDGKYTVTVSNDLGCAYGPVAVTVGAPDVLPMITVTKVAPQTSCDADDPNGVLSANVQGNTTDYIFEWYLGSSVKATPDYTGAAITGLLAGDYIVRATATATGCSRTSPARVDPNVNYPIFKPATITKNTICDDDNENGNDYNGAISLAIEFAGNPVTDFTDYTITWYEGASTSGTLIASATSVTLSNVKGGQYTVVVSHDELGCTAQKTYTVDDNTSKPVVTVEQKAPQTSCDDTMPNGILSAHVGSNTTDYTFAWYEGDESNMGTTIIGTSHELTNRASGDYTVVVTSKATGCEGIREFYLSEDINEPSLALDGSVTHFTNCSAANGAITVALTDAGPSTSGHTYTWYRYGVEITGETGPSISGLTPGEYTVTVTNDFTHCTSAIFTAEVEDYTTPLTVIEDITKALECDDGSNTNVETGAIRLTTIDGIALPNTRFEFEWKAGSPTDPNASFYTDPSVAFHPYADNFNGNGKTTHHLTDVASSTYSVIITDNDTGCKTIRSYLVGFVDSEEFDVATTVVNHSTVCFDTNDPDAHGNGSIELSLIDMPTNDINDYIFRWYKGSNVDEDERLPETSHVITGLSPGTYTAIAVRNFGAVEGCQIADITIEIEQIAQPPLLSASITDNTYCVGNNGAITVVASKVIPSDPAWPDDDSDGYSFTWYDEEDDELANADVTNAPYEHTLPNLAKGDYTVRVTNIKTGCFKEETYTVQDKRIVPEIKDAAFIHQDVCKPSGSIIIEDAHVSPGNIADYTFTWYKGGKTSSDIISSAGGVGRNVLDKNTYLEMGAGTYYVTITTTDGTGCTSPAYEVTIDDNSVEPTLAFEQTSNTACDWDHANGSITATATTDPASDAGDLIFTWFIVHDDGTETEFVDGTHGDIDNNTAFESTIKNVEPGKYKVTVLDTETGCEFTDSWEVKHDPVMPSIVSYEAHNQDICDPSGSIEISGITGASADLSDYIFTWYKNGTDVADIVLKGKNLFALNSSTYLNMGAGTYYVEITTDIPNSKGCPSGIYEIPILDKSKNPDIDFDQTSNTACDTENGANGTLKATATDHLNVALTNVTFDWFVGEDTSVPYQGIPNTNGNESEISGLTSGWYTLKVTNNDTGCPTTSSVWVENDLLNPAITNATIQHRDMCTFNGSIVIEDSHVSSGDVDDYTFTWYRGSTNVDDIIADVDGHVLDKDTYPEIGEDTYYVVATILGCETPPFTAIIENNIPPLTIAVTDHQPQTSCMDDNGAVTITINEDTDYANYLNKYEIKWYEGINTDPLTTATALSEYDDQYAVNDIGAGEYTIHVWNNTTECFAYRPIYIEDKVAAPIISPSKEDVTSCSVNNGSAFVGVRNPSVSGNYEYEWFLGNLNGHPGTASDYTGQSLDILSIGDYTVFVTEYDASNTALCTTKGHVTIEDKRVDPAPIVFEESPLTNCDDGDPSKSNGQLRASVGGNTFDYIFEWYHGTTPNGAPVYTGPVFSGLTNATYTVRAISNFSGCYTDISYTVSEAQEAVPAPQLTVSNRTNCDYPNGQIMATVAENSYNYTFNWYKGNEVRANAKLNQTSQLAIGLDVGAYTVTVTNLITGCTSGPATVTVGEDYIYPKFEVITENASCKEPNGLATLNLGNVPSSEIIWETYNGWEKGTSVRALPAGTYKVTVVSQEGCSTTKEFTIGTDINVFNGVSPNGDNRNDFFEIDCITDFPTNNVKIFNRAGTLVFEMDGYDNETKVFEGKGNRGLYLIGNDLPDGTYFYVVEKNDGSKPKTGYLELLR